jgi:exosortase A-associated hydrolase 1
VSAFREETFLFDSGDARLIGIVALPASSPERQAPAATLGVLVVVGGPQYRVGSHRQFVLLARSLASRGFAVMRFDCTGMGDSGGEPKAFSDRDADIHAAIDTFVARVPTVAQIAIWGLCDAASAALMYAPQDARVRHLVLLNPWVRSQAGLARTHLKHYYTRRLVDPIFWSNFVRGRVGVFRAMRDLVATVLASRRPEVPSDESPLDFQTRMARGWKRFRGDVLLICSGDDLTAREFVDHAGRDVEWRGLLEESRVHRCNFADADHTFSRAEWRDHVADETAGWLTRRTSTSPSESRRFESSGRDGRTRVTA